MIKRRSERKMKFILTVVVLLNLLLLVIGLTMKEDLLFLHIPLLIGCLIAFFPPSCRMLMGITYSKVGRYTLLKGFVLAVILINMALVLCNSKLAGYIYPVIPILYVIPDVLFILPSIFSMLKLGFEAVKRE